MWDVEKYESNVLYTCFFSPSMCCYRGNSHKTTRKSTTASAICYPNPPHIFRVADLSAED